MTGATGGQMAEMADTSASTTAARLAFGQVGAGGGLTAPEARGAVAVRTLVRSLTDHQKEALVVSSEGGPARRLSSDEGGYFGGTDLAPPPLGIFAAGVAASCGGCSRWAGGCASCTLSAPPRWTSM